MIGWKALRFPVALFGRIADGIIVGRLVVVVVVLIVGIGIIVVAAAAVVVLLVGCGWSALRGR